ncbi:MAG: cellulase family glycosylhydrolase [Mangrovibacterium sp.]
MTKWLTFFSCLLLFACTQKTDNREFAPLFPFLISYNSPDNATSMAHLLDAPAGKNGFIRVENGRFVNDAGPVRLHATNLTGPANFPTHTQADRLAARLARFGINCVRLHYMDDFYGNFRNEKQQGIIANDIATQRNLDSTQVERLDYMIAVFKKRGIYVNINLHVARFWDERDGFTGKDKRPWADKGLDNFEPRMIELQKEYARKLLTHVNPYTGLAYTEDPCVAMIEINNENALFNQFHNGAIDRLPDPYASEFHKQWNDWVRRKYPSAESLLKAWEWKEMPLTGEQITEGSFDAPVSIDGKEWILSLGSAKASAGAGVGILKIDVAQNGNEYFPKLFRSISVKKDQPYTLSFKARRAKGNGETVLGMAIADQKNGWRSLGLTLRLNVDSTWRTFSYSFTAIDDSDEAQFQLTRFKTGSYEIDDLSFQSGAVCKFDPAACFSDEALPTLHQMGYAPRQAVRDFYQFLMDTEEKYWVGMYDFLKGELKVKSVVSGTQLGYSPPFIQAQLDYVDNHSYWCHPGPVSPDWQIRNEAMVNSMSCIRGLAAQRVLNKPYTVSEYNHPFPNQYGAEGQPMLRAYGRLQGWDGVFEYTYNHRADFEPTDNSYFFSIVSRTDVLAHFPACAAIYLRGDVAESKSPVIGLIDYPTYFDHLTSDKSVGTGIESAGIDSRQSMLHKTAIDLSGKEGANLSTFEEIPDDQKIFVSDTGELTWNVEKKGGGYFTVNTPNTKLFSGFPEGRMISLGEVLLEIGRTRLGWTTISLVSRDATGFGESGGPANILLAATGFAENEKMTIKQMSGSQITLADWGRGSIYMEGIPATVTLPANPAKTKCFALGPDGTRMKEVAVAKGEGGGSEIIIGPEYKTVWYEIDIQ